MSESYTIYLKKKLNLKLNVKYSFFVEQMKMDQKNLKLFNTDKYDCTIGIQYFLQKLSVKTQKIKKNNKSIMEK